MYERTSVYGFCINIVKMKRSYFFLLKVNTVIQRIICYSSVDQKRSEAESSCVFMKSDESIGHPPNFRYNISLTDIIKIYMVFYYVIISFDILTFAHTEIHVYEST